MLLDGENSSYKFQVFSRVVVEWDGDVKTVPILTKSSLGCSAERYG